jgi:hypothetical protein
MNSLPSSSPVYVCVCVCVCMCVCVCVCVCVRLFLYVNNVDKGGGSRYKLPGLCSSKGGPELTLHMFLSF